MSSSIGPACAARPRRRLAVGLARPADVGVGDVGERDKLHAIDLDLGPTDAVAPTDLCLGRRHSRKRDRDVAGGDVVVELLAELHRTDLRRWLTRWDLGQYCQARTQSIYMVAGSGVVPASKLSLPVMPRAEVKARKKGWLKGSGAASGLGTWDP